MDAQHVPTTLDDVRLAVFRQHTQLGQLIDELEAHATAVLTEDGEHERLKRALTLFSTRFVRHLEYEEAHLTKWLPAIDSGPSLLGDHRDQKLDLQGLVHDRDVFGDPRTLARAVLAFVHRLRKDMVDEDAGLRALRPG